ncbi:ThiF family adenylyltransferase [Paenibacillus gansuensis]|uniref:ThiF family adenylyltransferase n=1 Tax=Paenibacillus gansuensis TaxID=306542 RepID=A0ABW5PGN8_9BACL
MFQRLVSHNDDLRLLVEKGYAVAFDNNCLVVRDIPYLDNQRRLQTGAIVSKLVFIDENRVTQDDHQIYFAGSVPHNLDGMPIPNLAGGPISLQLGEASKDVVVERSFSNKPRIDGRFADFFDKIESYVGILSGPAMELFDVNPYTFRIVEHVETDSVFKLNDTLTSKAEITDLSAKFKDDIVAVIGLGGTGGYVLDFLAKTPVREIRTFDLDRFYVHNAFRSPGMLQLGELGKHKTEVYAARYENFRTGVTAEAKFIDATSSADLAGVTFAFVCVDKGSSRAGIFDLLISMHIPFIDVGMGLKRKNGALNGLLRTTYYSADDGQNMRDKGYAELSDGPENLYRSNVQIGELNALNASLAIIRFKQLRGFYLEEENPQHHFLFEISDLKIVGASSNED